MKETEARRLLKHWEGDPKAALPHVDRIRFEELSKDYLNDYRTNGRRTLAKATEQVERLRGWFGGRRASTINSADVRAYIAKRQADKAANGTINRELAALKRMFNLAMQPEKLTRKPYIPMLKENNVRTGFFSEIDYLALREALPSYLQPPTAFAYTFGWRKSEILNLTWDRVDLTAGTVRLDPGTTKNREGRTVILTPDLRAVLLEQWKQACLIVKKRTPEATSRDIAEAIPWAFHRNGKQIRDFRGSLGDRLHNGRNAAAPLPRPAPDGCA